jgi:hypothetical protein
VNIANTEADYDMVAKTCGRREEKRKVTYSFIDSSHVLCRDKKDIILSELRACERLLKYTRDENEKNTIEEEVVELKMTLDLIQ